MTMAKGEVDRTEYIRLVMEERKHLAIVGKELLQLLAEHKVGLSSNFDKNEDGRNIKLQLDKKVLDLAQHLGNLAGFCDSRSRKVIQSFTTRVLGMSMFKGYSYIYLRALLPTIVGIQVDYTRKPPFKLIGFDVKALGSQIMAIAQR